MAGSFGGTFVFPKMLGISWLDEQLLGSQEGIG
jgi:hypothetical protein